ncbi:MAG: hypothetical protein U0703_12845 [Anaerolineae bacterium]
MLVIPVMLVLLGVTSFSSIIGSIGGLLGAGAPPQAQVIGTQTVVEASSRWGSWSASARSCQSRRAGQRLSGRVQLVRLPRQSRRAGRGRG